MVIVWLVDINRFVQEYRNHILDTELKHINWLVDNKTGFLRMYITATNGFEVYCYIHEDTVDTLPSDIKTRLTKSGMVLGTISLPDTNNIMADTNELVSGLVNEFKGLKFNQASGGGK